MILRHLKSFQVILGQYCHFSHLFRIRNNLAPSYLLPNFTSISAVHSHNTRGSEFNFTLSRDLSQSQNGFAFTAIKHWNSLPNSIKSITEFRVFKRKLKEFLLSQYKWFYWSYWMDSLYGTDSLMFLRLRFYTFYIVTNLFYKDPVGKKSLSKTFMGYPWGQTVTTLVL